MLLLLFFLLHYPLLQFLRHHHLRLRHDASSSSSFFNSSFISYFHSKFSFEVSSHPHVHHHHHSHLRHDFHSSLFRSSIVWSQFSSFASFSFCLHALIHSFIFFISVFSFITFVPYIILFISIIFVRWVMRSSCSPFPVHDALLDFFFIFPISLSKHFLLLWSAVLMWNQGSRVWSDDTWMRSAVWSIRIPRMLRSRKSDFIFFHIFFFLSFGDHSLWIKGKDETKYLKTRFLIFLSFFFFFALHACVEEAGMDMWSCGIFARSSQR